MKRSSLSRAASLVLEASERLVLLFLLAASIPPVLVRHASLPGVGTLNLLDGSWLLDISYKAAGGIWLGRDVTFTYGPLFQWLSSAPARWIGISTGAIHATWYTAPLLLIIVATLLTARLLLSEVAAWRRALLLLLAVVFWSPPDLRVALCLLAFAIFVRITDAVAAGKPIALRASASAAVCVAAFWLSADTGIYTVVALLLCVAATAMVKRRRPGLLARFVIVVAVGFVVLVFVTNAALFSLWDFQFWRSGLVIATAYRWFEPSAMQKPDKHLLLASVGLAIAVFGAAWYWRRSGGVRRPAFLLSGFCFVLVILESAVVRSDHVHILIGIYPVLFLCGVLAMDEFDARWLSLASPAAVVIVTLVLASAYPLFYSRNVFSRWWHFVHPQLTCPAGTTEFDHACFSPTAVALLTDVVRYVNSQTVSGDPIAVFPYQNAFGLASRHQVAGGVLQDYLVNGEYLTALQLAGLQRAHPKFALYLPEGALSEEIDGIPNFTRSPEVWFYLLEHYRSAGSPRPGVEGLLRDDDRAYRLTLAETKIGDAIGPTTIRERSSAIELPVRDWPVAGADFLKVRVQVNYPVWWRVRKPSKLFIVISFADGTEKTVQFVLPPDHASEIWIYPWHSAEMGRYFSEDADLWPREGRSAITSLKLLVAPYDWISVMPTALTIEKIEAVELQMK